MMRMQSITSIVDRERRTSKFSEVAEWAIRRYPSGTEKLTDGVLECRVTG